MPVPATGPSAVNQRHSGIASDLLMNSTDSSASRHNGTVLAFDFGSKRIGTAVGETLTGTAHPLSTIHAEDKQRRYAAIAALIAEWIKGLAADKP